MAKASRSSTPEERARRRVKSFTDLMWHVVTFLIVNTFMWLVVPHAAFWVSAVWGVSLAFHIAAYLLDRSGGQNRKYQRFLAEEHDLESGAGQ